MVRFEQFDYEIFGVEDTWHLSKSLDILTSFEMENKGYFERQNFEVIFDKVKNKYRLYLTKMMVNKILHYHTPKEVYEEMEDLYGEYPEYVIDPLTTTFSRDVLLRCIEDNNLLDVDLVALKRLLFCAQNAVKVSRHEGHHDLIHVSAQNSDHTRKCVYGANEKWSANRSIKNKITKYVIETVADGCMCNHAQLGRFIYEKSVDKETGEYLLEGADDAKVSEEVVIQTVKVVFEAEGISRIKGMPGVKDCKDCSVHQKEFKK
ncbi:hypothetical protein LPW11_16435 [Geomonas sp. RF6]|uniref:hypothetical protein n=1 Tax=Geomonas sp. RF6 TaxID=2897342 RepID=UPI001E3BF047|nr:hypothetical protein [Geomonas sp. RF6]UFS69475.1 hypothetical protein LPW11_16435 [Geomonas sp. RF6]